MQDFERNREMLFKEQWKQKWEPFIHDGNQQAIQAWIKVKILQVEVRRGNGKKVKAPF